MPPALYSVVLGFVGGFAAFLLFRSFDSSSGTDTKEVIRNNRTLYAESFVLTDSSGKQRAVLGFAGKHPILMLTNDTMNAEAVLKVEDDGMFLRFSENGKARIGLGLQPDGTRGLALADPNGHQRALLSVDSRGASSLVLADRVGRVNVQLVTPAGDDPFLRLSNTDGNLLAKLPV